MEKPRLKATYLGIILITAGVTAAIAALLVNIHSRKEEAKTTYVRLVEVTENDVDPAKWGQNFPREYDGYLRTGDQSATKYGGSIMGPEGGLPPEKAERDPWLTRVFAGYLFAIDYRDRRGHAHMLRDQEITKRNVPEAKKQSGNCMHCHASVMPAYRKLGKEALPNGTQEEQEYKGLELAGAMNYWDLHDYLGKMNAGPHPVACIDCHDPKTMELRVTRPGFIAAIRKLANSPAPLPHLASIERWRKGDRKVAYSPNTDATRQEMRSYVCAQCHVEYFCGKGETLFFPWDKGLKMEEIEQTYNSMQTKGAQFRDWSHAETGFPVLKAQHPEFEVWSQGVHARSGVACADCHMPYKREGAMKVSEHWVRSPLLMVNRACQTCHPYPENELKQRVETIQDRHFALLTRAGAAAVAMLDAIGRVKKTYDDAGWKEALAKDPRIQELAALQRASQWRLDYVAAENSMGFHAPQELSRILAESIDMSRQAETKATAILGKLAVADPVPPTKAAAPAIPAKKP